MDEEWLNTRLKMVTAKVAAELLRLQGATPYIPYDGSYGDVVAERGIDWWTNGFWGGLLWQLYHATGRVAFKQGAILQEQRLDKALAQFNDIHHDVGFMWLLTSVAHYRVDGDAQARRTGLHAATLLAGRFNPAGNYLVAWNDHHPGWLIIDSMMNIQLLYWASNETDDPRFAQIATRHAHTVLATLVRQDGSVGHIANFDPDTGAFLGIRGGQGVNDDSAWTRGNAWAVYGFAQTYAQTHDPVFLDAAVHIADYFIAHTKASNWLAPVDFAQPKQPAIHDTSASLIAACGLLALAPLVNDAAAAKRYREAAVAMVQACDTHYCDWDLDDDGIVGGGTEAYHRPATYEVPLIYSDYYFVEALLRLQHRALPIFG